jgi:hypothetical protein
MVAHEIPVLMVAMMTTAAEVVVVVVVVVAVVAVVAEAVVVEHDQVAMTVSGVRFLTSVATWARESLVTGRFFNS